jgi:hypothetical protein
MLVCCIFIYFYICWILLTQQGTRLTFVVYLVNEIVSWKSLFQLPSTTPQAQGGVNPTLFCDNASSSGSGSSQGSTPPTPLSSACLLVAAAVGPLAPGFKFPKTKKV